MKLFRLFLIGLIALTAVSCSTNANSPVPTQVPTAAPLAGPPGTNKLNEPWISTTNPNIGVSIEHPSDWIGTSMAETIQISPFNDLMLTNSNNLPVNVSILNGDESANSLEIVSALETLITPEALGNPESITIQVEPTLVSINGFEVAEAQLIVKPAAFEPTDEDLEASELSTFDAPEEIFLFITAVRQQNRTIVFGGSSPPEFSKSYLPIFESILQTIEFKEIGANE